MLSKKFLISGVIFAVGCAVIISTYYILVIIKPLPIITYPVTVSTDQNGTASPVGTFNVNHGSSTVLNFIPNPGFQIDTILVDGVSTTASTTLQLDSVYASTSIRATFIPVNYTIKKNLVYWKGNLVSGIDLDTFKVLGDDYGKDRFGVFYATGERVKGADSDSFVSLKNGFSRDSKFVYWATSQIYGADVTSFKNLDDSYSSDNNHIYYADKPLTEINKDTFITLGGGYAKDKNAVYYLGAAMGNTDFTIEALSYGYARDAKSVFIGGTIIPGADPATFSVLPGGYYTKDKNSVYFQFDKIVNADPVSFTVLPTNEGISIGKDKNTIYSGYTPLPLLNLNETKLFGDYFLTDNKKVYFNGIEIVGIDALSFNFLGGGFSYDKNGLWNGVEFVKSIQKDDEYRYLGDVFATDGKNVFLGKNVLPDADPDTFVFLPGSGYSYDKHNVYYSDAIISSSSNSFTLLSTSNGYAKTSSEVFFNGIKIPSADVASFRVEHDNYNFYAVDKFQRYRQGVVVEKGGMTPADYEVLESEVQLLDSENI